MDPQAVARAVAIDMSDEPSHVGEFIEAIAMDGQVTDFRFAAMLRGYEGWQWSVTLYHDVEQDRWTVNESSLIPGQDALLPPPWIPWKDRLEPSDLSVTDSIGTDPDDPRLQEGLPQDAVPREPDGESRGADATGDEGKSSSYENAQAVEDASDAQQEDLRDAVETFGLSRRHVLSALGRAQTARRWYEGPRGPKSLSTRTAGGNPCSTCGFFVPLQGELRTMFGVCANKWSPDDGRVVSLDHGCGEHSEIAPPEPSRLWIQAKPAFDSLNIDVVRQSPRDERADVELIEQLSESLESIEDDIDDGAATAEEIAEVSTGDVDVHADSPSDGVDEVNDTDNAEATDDARDDGIDEVDTSAESDGVADGDTERAADDESVEADIAGATETRAAAVVLQPPAPPIMTAQHEPQVDEADCENEGDELA